MARRVAQLPGMGKDLTFIKARNSELFLRGMPNLTVEKLDKNASQSDDADDLYGESRVRAWSAPVTIRAFAQIDPEEDLLTRFGIQQKRDVVFWLSQQLLDEVSLTVETGDRIKYDGIYYEVMSVHRSDFHVNYQDPTTGRLLPVQQFATANRLKDES